MSAVLVESAKVGSDHDLWLSGGEVLTVTLNRDSNAFPPDREKLKSLNDMVQGLARAIKSVIFHAENDTENDTHFLMQPIESLADAILVLSQMADGVQGELNRKD